MSKENKFSSQGTGKQKSIETKVIGRLSSYSRKIKKDNVFMSFANRIQKGEKIIDATQAYVQDPLLLENKNDITRKSDRTKKERKIADYTEFTKIYHENGGSNSVIPVVISPKEEVSEAVVATETPPPVVVIRKRERGRPPNSLKKKVIKKTGGKRGRPRLDPEEKLRKQNLLKKGRKPKKEKQAPKQSNIIKLNGAGEAEPIIKRPPGRPRKYMSAEESAEAQKKITFKKLKALSNISLYQAMVEVKDFLRMQKKNKVTKLI